MNFGPRGIGWVPIGDADARQILEASNPLREAWSDGELYYEAPINRRRVDLVFHLSRGGWWRPPPRNVAQTAAARQVAGPPIEPGKPSP